LGSFDTSRWSEHIGGSPAFERERRVPKMAVKAFVLIEAQVGKTGEVIEGIQKVGGVKSADSVAGL